MQPPANKPAPAVPYFTPVQVPTAGTAFDPQPDENCIPKLFQPIRIRGTTFHNHIFLSPLAQYSADDGHLTSWHMAHHKHSPDSVGGIFTHGPGLSMIEATVVVSEGRVTAKDAGLWKDGQIEPLCKIVGIQLAHAGWKASTVVPWLSSGVAATERIGRWPDNVWGPSTVPYKDTYPVPKEISKAQINAIIIAFAEATRRAPISNKRTDEYGGSFENHIRLTIEIIDTIRDVIPENMPLALRVSATGWLEGALPNEPLWHIEDTVKLAGILAKHGIDFLDVSSGGNHPKAIMKVGLAYQAPFAQAVKEAVGDKLVVGSVGSITNGKIAQEVLDKGQADVVLVGQQFQKNPGAVWVFASDLGVAIKLANQIEWGFGGRGKSHKRIDW
ncbi:hypothetical protein BD769DRAFT_1654477 [Suillus cothurnatus]|nr:hypothetical protein BD769DRAFT_1654477 [Suillus cothurnatus]